MLPFVYNERKEGNSKQNPVGENFRKSQSQWDIGLLSCGRETHHPKTEESQGETPLPKLGRNCHQNQGAFPAPHQSPVIYSKLVGTQLGK